ncbi:MAG: C45 family peptidase [Dehalococcoidia bacterium]
MKSVLLVILLVFIFIGAACTSSAGTIGSDKDLKFIAEFEGGKLYKAGEVSVLELKGNYRQMGRQYGQLLKSELNELYDISANKEYIRKQGFTYERMKYIGEFLFAFYPQKYKEILYGMAETSGLGLDKQLILNAIEWHPKLGTGAHKCSGIGVWGSYTKDGSLIFGRNNDDTAFFKEFGKYMVVAIFKANDSSINTALINYAGVIYAANGINSEGIFLELNSGNGMGFHAERTSIFVTLFSFLQDYPSIKEMSAAFQSVRVNLSSIVNVADKDIAYSFELPTDNATRREPDKAGLIAATNHFVDPCWNLAELPDNASTAYTVTRRNNLLTLADKYKGQFDVEKMQQVLDTTIEKGGATDSIGTIYQIIAVPKDLTLWLKAPGNFDWQKVNISSLLQ